MMAAYLWTDTIHAEVAARGPQMVRSHRPHHLLEPHSGLQMAGHCHGLQTGFPAHNMSIKWMTGGSEDIPLT